MKRLDLHIHTISSPLDNPFEFSYKALQDHVNSNKLDAIAITNHNLFDRKNYEAISNSFKNTIVYPGIEVSVEGFHVLVICAKEDVDKLEAQTKRLPEISQKDSGISIDEFTDLFCKSNWLVIPHFDKKPAITQEALTQIASAVSALEVGSRKKWIKPAKDTHGKPVVLFSDFRAYEKKENRSTGRYTYLDIEDLSFPSLRLAFGDPTRFSISDAEETFEIIPGLKASLKFNVVIGSRSSGKTYLLETLANTYDQDNVKYIKQFQIVSEAEESNFDLRIANDAKEVKENYNRELRELFEKAAALPSRKSYKKSIKNYISSLIKYAETTSLQDQYSKSPLYSVSDLPDIEFSEEKKVVEAVIELLDAKTLRAEIESFIGIENLKKLLKIALARYRELRIQAEARNKTNAVIGIIKDRLAEKSKRPKCPSSPLKSCAKRAIFIERLANLKEGTRVSKEISREPVGRFERIVMRKQYDNLQSLKKAMGVTAPLRGLLEKDDSEFVETILSLEEEAKLEQAFFSLDVSLKNDRGEDVSGGQKAEYLFLQEIGNASSYDLVLVDEPESSFDNPFLYESIIKQLKKLSAHTTVFVSTHNNVLGVSSKADWIVYATVDESGNHIIYSGNSSSESLCSSTGKLKKRSEILLKLMEAGETAYLERSQAYETT